MPEKARMIIVCTRVGKGEVLAPIEGSRQEKCSICKLPIWVSPSTDLTVQSGLFPSDEFLCVVCALEEL